MRIFPDSGLLRWSDIKHRSTSQTRPALARENATSRRARHSRLQTSGLTWGARFTKWRTTFEHSRRRATSAAERRTCRPGTAAPGRPLCRLDCRPDLGAADGAIRRATSPVVVSGFARLHASTHAASLSTAARLGSQKRRGISRTAEPTRSASAQPARTLGRKREPAARSPSAANDAPVPTVEPATVSRDVIRRVMQSVRLSPLRGHSCRLA
jgi:hypothetical protein